MTKFTVDFKLHCFIPVEVEAETLEEAEQKAEAIAMRVWDDLDKIWDGRGKPHCDVGFDELEQLQTLTGHSGDEDITEAA